MPSVGEKLLTGHELQVGCCEDEGPTEVPGRPRRDRKPDV